MSNSELILTKRHLLAGIATVATGIAVSTVASPAFAAAEMPKSDHDVDMAEVMKPGPLPDMALGKPDAPVKIVEYFSMTCPHCAHFHATTFDTIKEKYIDTGKVYFVFREFPFDPAATAAFMLARCAPKDQYYPFITMFLKQQRSWAAPDNGDVRGAMLQMSKMAGFTQESFQACLTNTKLAGDVTAMRDLGAKQFGVNATPTFLINGKSYSGDMSVESMSALIDSLL
ncbi:MULTISPECIES: DsbA family protein [Rhizobium/Agrobacterium group]|uniref:DsbA family protein n=1 Tax=Agrobacterium vitis TaxID=373 RepID=A0AAE2UWQ3_AGRVI|nr:MULTISPECIES: DsbA family protein [Rhizobium/Agrobacterium group]MBF2716930.1 DsbA family protein [Agrobacterium vitis]MCF1473057.1 DsbA family protein [Allorhizobium ampelinum]MUZ61589.1 thioredoxin domain-containing protein [Agrobacterium vitis]